MTIEADDVIIVQLASGMLIIGTIPGWVKDPETDDEIDIANPIQFSTQRDQEGSYQAVFTELGAFGQKRLEQVKIHKHQLLVRPYLASDEVASLYKEAMADRDHVSLDDEDREDGMPPGTILSNKH